MTFFLKFAFSTQAIFFFDVTGSMVIFAVMQSSWPQSLWLKEQLQTKPSTQDPYCPKWTIWEHPFIPFPPSFSVDHFASGGSDQHQPFWQVESVCQLISQPDVPCYFCDRNICMIKRSLRFKSQTTYRCLEKCCVVVRMTWLSVPIHIKKSSKCETHWKDA